MNQEYPFSSPDIRKIHNDLAIKASGTQQSRVQHIRPVGGGHEDNTFSGVKAIHLYQKLVEGLFTLIVSAAYACAAMAAHGVQFIQEDDAGSALPSGLKQVANSGRANAHKHFHKVRAADGKERYIRLSSHCTGQKRLSRTWPTYKKYAFGYSTTQFCELLSILQKIYYFLEILLGLITAGNIIKRLLCLIVRMQACSTLAKCQSSVSRSLHLS